MKRKPQVGAAKRCNKEKDLGNGDDFWLFFFNRLSSNRPVTFLEKMFFYFSEKL